ncbi:MAG: hypothetical protein JSR97_07390 [Verrucomicrobia bacterium]|nr:hypothetical protein [Verrucomicrobiota bacterium]
MENMTMRRSAKRPWILFVCLLSVLVWPTFFVDSVRGRLIRLIAPVARYLPPSALEELQRLEAENHLLRLELAKLQQTCEQLGQLPHETPPSQVVCAHVIYRDPSQWMNSCWVDVGQQTNQLLGKQIISKNSPVVVGKALVGIVDWVGPRQSRIRLITDVALKPSVRAVRGYLQDVILADQITSILTHLNGRLHLADSKEKQTTIFFLEQLHKNLSHPSSSWLLAKGVLHGAGAPLWRSKSHCLRGIGFNYDFSDPEDNSVKNTSLKPGKNPSMPILMEQDLLVTSGMDGVFPMGLPVAEVSKILPRREGSYVYEIEATPITKNLEALQTVCILPATDFINP